VIQEIQRNEIVIFEWPNGDVGSVAFLAVRVTPISGNIQTRLGWSLFSPINGCSDTQFPNCSLVFLGPVFPLGGRFGEMNPSRKRSHIGKPISIRVLVPLKLFQRFHALPISYVDR
jgi:hypothetical protein